MREYQLFINGEYRAATSGKVDECINPATGEVYARVHQANIEDAHLALDAAWDAFQSWKRIGPSEREKIILNSAAVMRSHAQELVDILVDEAGSTLLKAGFEAHHTPEFLTGIAGECRRVMGDTYLSDYPGLQSYSIRRPKGVVLSIAPFNFPLLLSIRKVGWALAAGNTVILKPSEATPVIGLKLAEIFKEAGMPDGVFNVLPAQAVDLGDTLIADPRVKKVTFTGSSRVGKLIAQTCGKYNKSVSLELGGKNPLIVLNDADLDYAVDAAAFSNYMHQGQVCMTGSRVIVEAGVYDQFVEKVTRKVAGVKCGDPREPGVVVGPLIRDTQPAFIQTQIEAAVEAGAKVMTGGSYQANYFQPTVLANVTQDMSIFTTECFGPVASVIKAEDHKHAVELANDSEYGLSAAVITNDLQKSMYMIEELETGMVHINGPTIRDEPVVPFGGIKDSGMGREGGRYCMEEFTELKWVTIQSGQQHFPF